MILLKIHKSQNSELIALCDANLIGEEFEEGNLYLKVTPSFYQGDELPEEKMLEILGKANNINIVGKESIKFTLENKLISKESIIKIKGIPHAQIFGL